MTSTTFDDQAGSYDTVALSRVGREYRHRVHLVVRPLLDETTRVLDLGCGTGLDLVWLATMVATVHAIDPSAEMVAVATARALEAQNVTIAQAEIASVNSEGCFDVVLANFGAINCVMSLHDAGSQISRLLAPGGYAVVVTMPPISPIERLAALMRRNRALWNRRTDGPTSVAGYKGLTLTYADASKIAEVMPRLEPVHTESLGLMLPGFEHRSVIENRPRTATVLARLDRLVSGIGGRLGWGDHIITVLQRPVR